MCTLIGKKVALCSCLLTVVSYDKTECELVCRHGSHYYIGTKVVITAEPVYERKALSSNG